MIARARQAAVASPWKDRATFTAGQAEGLDGVPTNRFDVVVCVGALEHMIDQQAALSACCRVLKPAGRFVCLTPNGDFLWYRVLAPLWKQPTRKLSTDHYLGRREAATLLRAAGFAAVRLHYWTFIPKGDMTALQGALMHGLDHLGKLVPLSSLRSGLVLTARKTRV